MNSLPPIFALIIYLIAFATAFLITKFAPLKKRDGRFETIDGLRGLLAIGVFIHHIAIWHQFLQTGKWASPTSHLYNHLGLLSVSFFFMITSFLFISKLIKTPQSMVSWGTFFRGRFLRIAPMYYVSFIMILLIIGIKSEWTLQEPIFNFIKSISHWGIFALHDSPDINRVFNTSIINAGVVWSLSYEWLFYFILPIIGVIFIKTIPFNLYAGISLLAAIVFYFVHGFQLYPMGAFVGGVIPALAIHKFQWNPYIRRYYADALILIFSAIILLFSSPQNPICLFLSSIIFYFIARGSSVFGLLKSPVIQFLGDISYSTYLLHGILLYGMINFGIGIDKAKSLSLETYLMLMCIACPVLVFISYTGFRWIESPFIEMAKNKFKSDKGH